MKDEIEFLNTRFRRRKKKTIQALNDAKYYQHVSPKGMMKLYNDTGLRVERVFKTKCRTVEVDRYSFCGADFTLYSSYKSNVIQDYYDAEEAFKGIRYLYVIESPILNDIRIITYVDSILTTYKNGSLYSVRFKKGKHEWIQFIDDIFKYEEC